MAAGLVQKIQ